MLKQIAKTGKQRDPFFKKASYILFIEGTQMTKVMFGHASEFAIDGNLIKKFIGFCKKLVFAT